MTAQPVVSRKLAFDFRTHGLSRYEAARKALAEALAVDEVKQIRDQAEAMRTYAALARDRRMEVDAAEIRIRAERRLGEMLIAYRKSIGVTGDDDPEISKKISAATKTGVVSPTAIGISGHLQVRGHPERSPGTPRYRRSL